MEQASAPAMPRDKSMHAPYRDTVDLMREAEESLAVTAFRAGYRQDHS